MPPGRMPRRAAAANKKYTVDAFAGIKNLVIVSSDSGSDTSEEDIEQSSSDPEVDSTILEVGEAEEEEILSGDDEVHTDDEQAPQDIETDCDETTSIIEHGILRKKRTTAHFSRRAEPLDPSKIHALPAFDTRGEKQGLIGVALRPRIARGIPEVGNNQAKETRVIYTVGPGQEDLVAHVKTRDKWMNDVTLPTRKTRKNGAGGLHYSFFYPEERREKEAAQGWEWYYEHGCQDIFGKHQETETLDAAGPSPGLDTIDIQKRELFRNSVSASDPFISGPVSEPKLYAGLGASCVMDTVDDSNGKDGQQAWLFNAGGRVQCLEWVPNRDGPSQYLAVTVTPTDKKGDETSGPYAYTTTSFRAYLQIWNFTALRPNKNESARIDFSIQPQLFAVISFDWGSVRKMRWCPTVLRKDSDIMVSHELHLGLLAGVWSDGKARVLDVRIPHLDHVSTQYIHFSKAAFESKPPDTLCTCITWLSSSSIAVGCANGSIAVWSLPSALKLLSQTPDREPPINPRPWLYHSLHQSYILSVTSCYPSRPHFLLTSSIDGYLRLTDLRSPTFDTIPTQRVRIAQAPLIWHEQTQSALCPDESFDVRSFNLRTFHKTHAVARVGALVGDMACSLVHASVLVGGVDGKVWATGPMRRERNHKNVPYQQIWFSHEWRRGIPQNKIASAFTTDAVDVQPAVLSGDRQDTEMLNVEQTPQRNSDDKANIMAKPLIRFTTGYKLSKPVLGQESRGNTTADGVAYTTIYEEKSAVTQVCWNPNLVCGTWAAAGMGSGLVRVEDLGVDL